MKNLILSVLILFSTVCLNAKDINPDVKPGPLETVGFKFPDYSVEKLSNGLKVFIVKDNEQPTVAFRLIIFGGTSVEGEKAGIAELTAGMLNKGTSKKNAFEIAQTIDGIGATLESSATTDYYSIYAESLKKHHKLLLEMMSDVLLNSVFDVEEFVKLQQQTIAGIEYEKSSSGSLAQALSRMAIYGKDHPYAIRKTENSVSSINVSDVKEFHSKWAKPNNASLVVVGDVNKEEIIKELEVYFKSWKKSDVPEIVIPEVQQLPKGIYFVSRPGSVQSSLIITTKAIPYNDRDYDRLSLAAQIIGGANGRLYQTLREKYSFTYSPYGFLTSTKFANRFAAVSEVAAEKTDSSITVIINELNDLANKAPSKDELDRVRSSFIGNYYMSFENSLFIASLIQNADFYGKKINELKSYDTKINSIIPDDITTMSKYYINPNNAQIIIVGDPSIIPSIEKYGQIYKYDLDLNPLSGTDAKIENISMSADNLISKYENAIGGKDNIAKILTLNAVSIAELTVNGQIVPGEVLSQKKAPNKLYNMSDFGIFKSEVWVNGVDAWSGQSGQPSVAQQGEAKEKMLFEAEMFSVLALKKHGYTLEVLGNQGDYILMSAKSKSGTESTYYFDKESYLLNKLEFSIEGPNGIKEIWNIVSEDYADFEGVKLPKVQKTISSAFTIKIMTNYEINKEIDDAVFTPQN